MRIVLTAVFHFTAGNGIGLTVVKVVVERHKGTVAVQSKNSLTTFTVMLPKSQPL